MSRQTIRLATDHRDVIIAETLQLTDNLIAELERKGRHLAVPDGFPARTLGDGTSRGTSLLTSVERAAESRVYHDAPPDNVGDAIRDVFEMLQAMADLASRVGRKIAFVRHVAEKSEGRVSSLQGECQACERVVSGAETDRLRAGYCDACRKAWERAGKPDRPGWELQRRRELAERAS